MEGGFTLSKSYRDFAWIFFGSALVLLIFLVYLLFARVIIVITPTAQTVSHDFVVEVTEGAVSGQNVISGRVRAVDVEASNTFNASGQQPVTTDIVGEVTISNHYSQAQTLVESTRLAAADKPDIVLVRLKKTVVVAPGQQVTVAVYPDKPDTFKDLPPMRLIFPGLWGPLREKIYAENAKPLSHAGQVAAVVTKDDLTQAEAKLSDQLKTQATAKVNDGLTAQQTFWPKLVAIDSRAVTFDAQAGAEVATFTATGKLRAVVVAFDESQIGELARQQLTGSLGDQRKLISLDQKSFTYSIESNDVGKHTAKVHVYVEGSSGLSENSSALAKDKLTNKTADEIKQYFSQFAEVKSVEVILSPPWLQRTPRLKEKIEIKIQGQ